MDKDKKEKTEERKTKFPTVDNGYIRPHLANQRINKAKGSKHTVYIYSVVGSGKTSLAARTLSNISEEDKAYFSMKEWREVQPQIEKILDSKEPPMAVVLDDLHELKNTDAWGVYTNLIARLSEREDIWLILISRAPVPKWLKTIYIRDGFIIITGEQIKLLDDEFTRFFANRHISMQQEIEEELIEFSEGHPLVLKIMALHLSELREQEADGKQFNQLEAEREALRRTKNDVYDYTELNVYDNWSIELQEFMTDLSIVEEFDIELARFITRKSSVESLVIQAMEIGDFIFLKEDGEKKSYTIRNAAMESLERRLRSRSSEEYISRLYESAATYYDLKGDVIKTLELYKRGGKDEGIKNILIRNARNHPGNGYFWELRDYYLKLPEETIRKSQELMEAMSMLQSIRLLDRESEYWYQELEKYKDSSTGSRKKEAEASLMYLNMALPHKKIKDLFRDIPKALLFRDKEETDLHELSITSNAPSIINGGKDFLEWIKNENLIKEGLEVGEKILRSSERGIISLALAEIYLEQGSNDFEAVSQASSGRWKAERAKKIELIFVAAAISAWVSLLNDEQEQALEQLMTFKTLAVKHSKALVRQVDTLIFRVILYKPDQRHMQAWMDESINEDEEFFSMARNEYMAKIRGYLALGYLRKAQRLCEMMLSYAKKRERIYIYIETLVLYSITLERMGQRAYRQYLQEAIELAEKYHITRVITREGAAILPLVENRRLVWNDKELKARILSECRKMANYYPSYLDHTKLEHELSDVAIRVLRMQAEGKTNSYIAEQLGVSASTIKYYNTDTYKKLGVSGKAEAIISARERKLI